MRYTIDTFIPSGEPSPNARTTPGNFGTFDVEAASLQDAASIARAKGHPHGRITFAGCHYPHTYTPTHVGA